MIWTNAIEIARSQGPKFAGGAGEPSVGRGRRDPSHHGQEEALHGQGTSVQPPGHDAIVSVQKPKGPIGGLQQQVMESVVGSSCLPSQAVPPSDPENRT